MLIIKKCNEAGKPFITATQMLDSMMRNPRPTRAEVTDVANAIYDGTDAIMLSGETAAGKYPVEAVRTMATIAKRAEETMKNKRDMINKSKNVTDAISYATCTTAMDLEARAILSSTSSGHTARMVSKFRPDCTIIATTSHESVRRQLSLTWGVLPVIREKSTNTDQVIVNSIEAAKAANYVSENDVVVITAGGNGTTNLIKVETV